MKATKFEVLDTQINRDTVKKLNSNVNERMIFIAGKCKALFDGRIKSTLDWGDHLLIIKKDLSILMHGATGVKPLNWQKPEAGPINFYEKDENLIIFTKRKKTKEELVITFRDITFFGIWHTIDESDIEIIGDESDLVQYLVNNPEKIEKKIQIIDTELSTDVGFVDIRALDHNQKLMILEVKKRQATPADAFQLKRYKEYFKQKEQKEVRAILVAPSFPEKVKEYLKQNDMEFKKIHWKDIFPIVKRVKKAKLDDFLQD